jgi:hypothetical protein
MATGAHNSGSVTHRRGRRDNGFGQCCQNGRPLTHGVIAFGLRVASTCPALSDGWARVERTVSDRWGRSK